LLFDELVPFTSFFGVISAEPISRIEFEAVDGLGELMGDLAFGTENVLSISENALDGFTYFPNPTNSVLSLKSVQTIDQVAIFNLLGQKVMAIEIGATLADIDVSGLTTGTYIMKVIVEGKTGTYKV